MCERLGYADAHIQNRSVFVVSSLSRSRSRSFVCSLRIWFHFTWKLPTALAKHWWSLVLFPFILEKCSRAPNLTKQKWNKHMYNMKTSKKNQPANGKWEEKMEDEKYIHWRRRRRWEWQLKGEKEWEGEGWWWWKSFITDNGGHRENKTQKMEWNIHSFIHLFILVDAAKQETKSFKMIIGTE